MIIIIPYKTNIKGKQVPWMNYIFISILLVIFVLSHLFPNAKKVGYFVLQGWSLSGILGHMWLHINIYHLVMNLICLWVFGNALCSYMGNKLYFFYYMFGGIIAAIGHLLMDGRPAIGASGSISAVIVALCLIFPYRRIRSTILLLVIPIRSFSLAGIWYLLIYFLYDLMRCLIGGGQIAYAAHIGGIIGGGVFTYLLIKMGFVSSENTNKAVVQNLYSEIG